MSIVIDSTMISPTTPTMSPQQFIDKWIGTEFGERQAAQLWFRDLLRLVGHPDPIEHNDRDNFTFERPVPGGFADAYLARHFGWEFKGREAQLPGAFDQLLRYQVYLQTPPLLIVSSFQLIRIQTNFPGKETVVHEIPIRELDQPEQLNKLINIFFDPGVFEPQRTVEEVTRETALLFSTIVEDMEKHSEDSEQLARYLNQVVFCLYAEDTRLLPDHLFTDITKTHYKKPGYFNQALQDLFSKMSDGGLFGKDIIARFNGDLFNESETVELSGVALYRLVEAVDKNWRDIEPSIFGTLFEGALDATKRSQLGAHYTSAADIMLVVEPVVMKPLRREWDEAKRQADDLSATGQNDQALAQIESFRDRLSKVTVLDPACGSGNFLYIALRSLLDLEKQVIDYAESHGWHGLRPSVNPGQMSGLEIDPYAAQLARTALWIGYIQWHQANGFPYTQDPILMPLDTIQQTDAILVLSDTDNPREQEWPAAEFIVGNPPFLGNTPFREQLGDDYADALYSLYQDRIPNTSDYCCYWFERARQSVEDRHAKRVGLLATQGIRGRASRRVLERIKDTGGIFLAYSDRPWVLDGAAVHVSIVCFDDGTQTEMELDGERVSSINSNLMTGADLTSARGLQENLGVGFKGIEKGGPFDIPNSLAHEMLEDSNPHGLSNHDVIKPWINGQDIVSRSRGRWIIDFHDMPLEQAALYEAPFEYVKSHVRPVRERNREQRTKTLWWRFRRSGGDVRMAVMPLKRYIVTPRTAKHRVFVWLYHDTLPDSAVVTIAKDDDYTFGVLHSHIHEVWARAMGTQLRDAESGFRYTATSTFETFPFPEQTDHQRHAISSAAADLNRLRENWLNPQNPGDDPALNPSTDKRRTLTGLYNVNPTWLQNAHTKLDTAVADAYGWPDDLPDHQILENLLALNLQRSEDE